MSELVWIRHARLRDGSIVDVRVDPARGTVAEVRSLDAVLAESGPRRGRRPAYEVADGEIDATGYLLLPALINGHAHLDKTFMGDGWHPHRPGVGVIERVAAERSVRARFSEAVDHRAGSLAEAMIGFGTGTVRTHVDIDLELGLRSLEAMLRLRERFADRLTMQIVAFPQSGIVSSPGVAALLAEALSLGADVVGGLDPVGFDGAADRHLDTVFGLAERHGAGIDIHLHELGESAARQLNAIAERTAASGMAGKVVVSHAYGLGSLPLESARRIGERLATAGVAVMTNGPAGPMPPVLAMRSEGVTVFSGSDNIRDAWWPFGDGDMLTIARQVAYQSNFRTDDELGVALELVTDEAARALGLSGYGIAPGTWADLVLVRAQSPAELIAAHVPDRIVVHRGRVVSSSRLLLDRPAVTAVGSPTADLLHPSAPPMHR